MRLLLVSVESGEKRALTTPPGAGEGGDFGAAFSPNGRTLEFNRFTGRDAGDVHLLALTEGLAPAGDPQRLTFENESVSRLSWTADGREIVFGAGNSWGAQVIKRIAVGDRGKPRRFDPAGEGASDPAISPDGRRMAYARRLLDVNIWAVRPAATPRQPMPFISSTRTDQNPQFSPDGRRIVFQSGRSGSEEIWLSDADGSNPVQLTDSGGPHKGTPRWSPDGRHIAFDWLVGGSRNIYVVSASGGAPWALTNQPSQERAPAWSRDGRWIYFSSDRGGSDQIWKIPADGGEGVQVTKNGGYIAFESWDGKSLFYTKTSAPGPLYQFVTGGGVESQVLESVFNRAFAVAQSGIYLISSPDARSVAKLQFLELATGVIRQIAALDKPLGLGLTVSPDGHVILYSKWDLVGSDLVLVENFR